MDEMSFIKNINKQKYKIITLGLTATLLFTPISKAGYTENDEIVEVKEYVSKDYNLENLESKADVLLNESKKILNKVEEKHSRIPIYNIPLSDHLQRYIFETCEDLGIEYELALGTIKLESMFKADIVSNNPTSYDQGLMQINNRYQDWYAELADLSTYDIFNPYDNVKMGLSGLKFYKDHWENKGYEGVKLTKMMLLSYNRGIAGAKKYVKNNGYDHAYTRLVFKYKDEIESKRMN